MSHENDPIRAQFVERHGQVDADMLMDEIHNMLHGGIPGETILKCDACRVGVKSWRGDDRKCAFARGTEWSSENWNCATTGLLRELFDDISDGERIAYWRSNDQHTGMIDVSDCGIEDGPISVWMTWYKHRGRTDQIWLMFHNKPPRLPTEADILAIAATYTQREE